MSNNEIQNWQTMWQTTKVKDDSGLNEIIQQVYTIEKQEKYQKIGLTLLLLILLITTIVRPYEVVENSYYPFAFGLVIVAILIRTMPLYKNKLGLTLDENNVTNYDFIQQLKQKTRFKGKDLLLVMLLLFLGLNCALLGLYERGTIFNFEFTESLQIVLHSLTIPLCIFGYWQKKRQLDEKMDTIFSMIKELETSV